MRWQTRKLQRQHPVPIRTIQSITASQSLHSRSLTNPKGNITREADTNFLCLFSLQRPIKLKNKMSRIPRSAHLDSVHLA